MIENQNCEQVDGDNIKTGVLMYLISAFGKEKTLALHVHLITLSVQAQPNRKSKSMKDIGFKELAFVGYSVTDFTKAKQFYGDVLGLKETVCMGSGDDIGWMEYDLAGQALALAKAFEHWMPDSNGGQVCLEVHDLDSAVSYLKARQVQIVQDIQDYPYCRLALISDPDGNTLTLHQKKADHPELTPKQ